MCMRVQSATRVTHVYDADTGTITLPIGLCPELAFYALSVVVAKLCLPVENGTPLCWCGEPLTISGLIPAQRTSEVTTHGA